MCVCVWSKADDDDDDDVEEGGEGDTGGIVPDLDGEREREIAKGEFLQRKPIQAHDIRS